MRFYESESRSGKGGGYDYTGEIPAGIGTGETPQDKYTAELWDSCAEYSDAAVVVFSRVCGEGYDLPRTMKTSYGEDAVAIDGANADDHYLQLDNNERSFI